MECPLTRTIHPSSAEWAEVVADVLVSDDSRREDVRERLTPMIEAIVADERANGRRVELAVSMLCQYSLVGKGPAPVDAAKAIANRCDEQPLPVLFAFGSSNGEPVTPAEHMWREKFESPDSDGVKLVATAMLSIINKERIRWHLRLGAMSLIATVASLPQLHGPAVSLQNIVDFCDNELICYCPHHTIAD